MNLHVFSDPEALSVGAAEWIIELIGRKLTSQQDFSWLLSGGNTPRKLYSVLSTEHYRSRIDWNKLQIFFGDERMVAFEDERNNGRMAYQTLLSHVPIHRNQIHLISTDKKPEIAANEYEDILNRYFKDKAGTFDLSLLGMGEDGHVLSLFPGSALIQEVKRNVANVFIPEQGISRVTLTARIVNQSSYGAFLVTGESKAFALKEILKGNFNPEKYPAQSIKLLDGELHWFVDEAAADLL